MNKLSTERVIEVLYTVRAYYASLTAGYPKGKDCKGIGDVMCSEIANSCLVAIKTLEQEPCDDCISRAWFKESIHNFYHGLKHTPTEEDIQAYIDAAPPVTPQPKTGKWIFHEPFDNGHKNCNECIECTRCHTWLGYNCYAKTPYCPYCGAKMEVSE